MSLPLYTQNRKDFQLSPNKITPKSKNSPEFCLSRRCGLYLSANIFPVFFYIYPLFPHIILHFHFINLKIILMLFSFFLFIVSMTVFD